MPELPGTPEEGVLRGRHCLQGLGLLPQRQPWLVVEQRARFGELVGLSLFGYEVVVRVQGRGGGLLLGLRFLRVRFEHRLRIELGLQLLDVEQQLQRLFRRLIRVLPFASFPLFAGTPPFSYGWGPSRMPVTGPLL